VLQLLDLLGEAAVGATGGSGLAEPLLRLIQVALEEVAPGDAVVGLVLKVGSILAACW